VRKIVADLFVLMNNGNPVSDVNVKSVALNYLTKRAGLTYTEIAAIQDILR